MALPHESARVGESIQKRHVSDEAAELVSIYSLVEKSPGE